jgi:hypothetical protein
MALVADPGLAMFAGLNVIPKKSYLSEYSSTVDHTKTLRLLSRWHGQKDVRSLFGGESFNLDFHSVPFHGDDPIVQKHFVSMRSRRQPSVLVFLAQDATGRAFCYANADLRKGEEADEVFRFIEFWKDTYRRLPRHLVFDSKLTTLPNLARLDQLNITFITLRRRDRTMIDRIAALPPSAWRRIELDVPTRKYRHPRVFEENVQIKGSTLRQIYVEDLGHDEPTVLLTNSPRKIGAASLVTRYAQRMLIENALSDAVRFFHMDALSSSVHLKVDFDMALLVMASAIYRRFAQRMKGYQDAQARQVFRDLLDTPAEIAIDDDTVRVHFPRRAHLPIIQASGLLDQTVQVPWWRGKRLVLSA